MSFPNIFMYPTSEIEWREIEKMRDFELGWLDLVKGS